MAANMKLVAEMLMLMNAEELDEVIDMVRARDGVLRRKAARAFDEGNMVEFEHKGIQWIGEITKVNQTKCKVLIDTGWGGRQHPCNVNVPASILRKVEVVP